MEKDINAIEPDLSTASEAVAKTKDVDKRVALLESQDGSMHQIHEHLGPLKVRVQDLIATEEHQNCEVTDFLRRVDALTALDPVVPSMVLMEGTVSALTTQVQLLDEEVECLKRETNSLRHELAQVSRLMINDVTLVMAQSPRIL